MMTVYAYINENINRIKSDIKTGLIPCSILRHWEVYSRYDVFKKIGNNTVESVYLTSEQMRLKERMIYLIIKKMEQPYETITDQLQ